jgi:hypothetical protein
LIEILFRARLVVFESGIDQAAIVKRLRIFRVEVNGLIKIGERAIIIYDHVSDASQIIESGLRGVDSDSLIHVVDGVASIG